MRKGIWISLTLAAAGVSLTACGSSTVSGTALSSSNSKSHKDAPTKIFPIPSGAISASSPMANGTLWVLAGNGASKGIFQISLATGKVIASVSVSKSASAVAQSQTGDIGVGIATPSGGGALEFYDGRSGVLTSTVPLSGGVVALCAGSDGKTFYVLTQVGSAMSVSAVDDVSGKVISTVAAPGGAVSLAVTPSEKHVYVVQPNGIASEISTSSGQIDGQFPVGHSAHSIAMSNDGSTLYVLKGQDPIRNVAVVDLATESVRKVLPAAGSSVGVSLSPGDSRLYDIVGNPSYGNIQVFMLS